MYKVFAYAELILLETRICESLIFTDMLSMKGYTLKFEISGYSRYAKERLPVFRSS